MPLTIQHAILLASLHDAYDLLYEFQKTIDSLEGDHPHAVAVEAWLCFYEQHLASVE